ncbi:MAG TPA: SDR family oxidoreductase [Steroidobacter sp.]|uniref:SDR family NAD(P)-dependent oxidoreductase n=1 Tax=Steroidobacter sp. TaxID=1978227 RepID=UPI002EDA3FF1
MNGLARKAALVTGGASGIGLATVEALTAAGAAVAINFLPGDAGGEEAVTQLERAGASVIAAPGDISVADAATAVVDLAVAKLGRLDYLVNNAGIAGTREPIPAHDLDRLDESFWTQLLSTNLMGSFWCTRAAASALRAARGAVVNVASIAGLDGVGSSIAYSASKAALVNLTKNLARGLAPNVRVNAVAPGYVATPWTRSWPAEKLASAVEATLLKRACTAEEVADVIVFLCERAAMITGQTIVVDGGLMLGERA